MRLRLLPPLVADLVLLAGVACAGPPEPAADAAAARGGRPEIEAKNTRFTQAHIVRDSATIDQGRYAIVNGEWRIYSNFWNADPAPPATPE